MILIFLEKSQPNWIDNLERHMNSNSWIDMDLYAASCEQPCGFPTNMDLMQYSKDNAIVRHGIHGLYKLWTVHINSVHFNVGTNIVFLTQRKTIGGPFTGIMYDYLLLKAPAAAAATLEGDPEISEHCTETLVEESSFCQWGSKPVWEQSASSLVLVCVPSLHRSVCMILTWMGQDLLK